MRDQVGKARNRVWESLKRFIVRAEDARRVIETCIIQTVKERDSSDLIRRSLEGVPRRKRGGCSDIVIDKLESKASRNAGCVLGRDGGIRRPPETVL